MDTLSNLCLFAKTHGSAAEKTIFLHIMIDLIYDYEKRHEEPPRRLVGYAAPSDEPVGDVYPTEDSHEWISPPPPLGEIPF